MKNIIHCIFSFLALMSGALSGYTQTNQKVADQITGVYWSPKKDAKIEIYKKGGRYFGKSVWSAHPRLDTNNPYQPLRTRALLGIDLLSDFVYRNGVYTSGTIYDPESGKTYDCKISWLGSDLKIRGFVGFSLFGRTEIFERVK